MADTPKLSETERLALVQAAATIVAHTIENPVLLGRLANVNYLEIEREGGLAKALGGVFDEVAKTYAEKKGPPPAPPTVQVGTYSR